MTHCIFTQMSAKEGISRFGERAVAAIFKELKQLNDGVLPGNPVMQPISLEDLSPEDKQKALEAVNLIKEKRCGKIKGRTCANGARQRRYVKDDEHFSSPTAALESIMTTLVVDAYENRDVAIADVPGAYLHAKFPKNKKVILKLVGIFVDIMCDVNPEYKKHVVFETDKRGQTIKVLYVRVLRALYGCLESALLWYELYSKTLLELGFRLNPYDKCVANKEINGTQCTIVFYVDDNKISHKDPDVKTDIINKISAHFGKLSVSRGSKHDYLGMNIEFKDGKVYVDMEDQVREAIEWGKAQVGKKPATPATTLLFTVDENSKPLSNEEREVFHSIVQKLMYLCKRARPDVEPVLSFLSTRVSCATYEDREKLVRLLDFLRETVKDKRILGAISLDTLFTWVDVLYAVHPNMRSHTGGTMSFGVGVIHSKSAKQKLNTKSSTEAELVGVSEYLPYHIWVINFLREQGYEPKNKFLFQDN